MPGDSINVHLAFPDGVLAYDCAVCDQRCCKTGALVVFPAERQSLIRRHPALELVTPPILEGITAFATPPSGCWFLEGSDCSLLDSANHENNTVHSAMRPVACTLFPFNLFGQLGDTLVVAPNGLCPFEVRRDGAVSHAQVLEVLDRVGAAGEPPLPLRPDAVGDQIALERLILDAATTSLDEPSPVPLIAFSKLATDAFLEHGADGLERPDVGSLDETVADLYARLDLYARIVGVPSPDDATLEAIAPMLAAWTGTLRLFGFPRTPIGQLPYAVLGLSLYVATWHALAPQRPLLPQGLMQLVSSLAPTIALLNAWSLPWAAGDVDGVPLRNGATPEQCLTDHLPDDPLERNTLLRRLSYARLVAPA